jgi:cyclopropane-fatty-acyl-phospholipid synthase
MCDGWHNSTLGQIVTISLFGGALIMSPGGSRSGLDRLFLRKINKLVGNAPIRVVMGQESQASPDDGRVATMIIRDRRTLGRVAFDPEIGFGDAYMEGRVEVRGDIVRFLEEAFRLMRSGRARSWGNRVFSRWLEFAQENTRKGSAKNIHRHYDLGNDFYKLWLDQRMVYTCAYFPSPDTPLEEAQVAKLDHVCRKMQLQPGERVVDAGCGWGALALHMAKHYGVTVQAFNISHEQVAYARAQAKAEGLAGQVEFIEDDYRNISGKFDAFVSVGMLEHVGREHYADLSRVVKNAIGDCGRGLIHFIGRNQRGDFSAWIRKHVFPGAYAPTLREALEIFEPHNYAVLDVENLRQHYARTLEHWLERFEQSVESVRKMFGAEFVRMWRLYLAGSTASFRTGGLQLFQVVFAGAECRQIPWTRAYLYTESHSEAAEADVEREWTSARY